MKKENSICEQKRSISKCWTQMINEKDAHQTNISFYKRTTLSFQDSKTALLMILN